MGFVSVAFETFIFCESEDGGRRSDWPNNTACDCVLFIYIYLYI